MKLTILLTGKTGQIGSHLYPLLTNLGEVIAPDRTRLNLSNPEAIRREVRDLRPNLIVNAAAYTAVDAAENDEPTARAINADALAIFAEEAKKIGAGIVHYSTDYVFDGRKKTAYCESDQTNPINVYGKTKLSGEEAIRDSGVPHLIFRTSWVYATRGRNFLMTILRLASERNELKIVRDQVGSPTCADDIATATIKVLTQIHRQNKDRPFVSSLTGTYHMTAGGETTWYNFAREILECATSASRGLAWFAAATQSRPLITRRVVPISTEEFQSTTHRPAYSVLSNALLMRTFHVALPDWTTQLQRCFAPEETACVPPTGRQ